MTTYALQKSDEERNPKTLQTCVGDNLQQRGIDYISERNLLCVPRCNGCELECQGEDADDRESRGKKLRFYFYYRDRHIGSNTHSEMRLGVSCPNENVAPETLVSSACDTLVFHSVFGNNDVVLLASSLDS